MGTYEHAAKQTKTKIAKAFWELYKKKRIEKITIKDITDACGIHRATFYLHYPDVYAVLEQIKNVLLNELCQTDSPSIQSPSDLTQFAHNLYVLYGQRRDYLHYLLLEQPEPEFSLRYRQILMDKLCCASGVDLTSLPPKTKSVVEMTLYGLVNMFIFWIDEDQLSFHDMMQISQGFINNGISKTLYEELGVRLQL